MLATGQRPFVKPVIHPVGAGIIGSMAGHGGETSTDALILEAAGWGSDVKVRVPPEHTAELRALLDDAGVPFSVGGEFSHGPVLDLLIVTVKEPAVWVALTGIIAAYLRRHSSRTVRAGDVTVTGYGADDAVRIVREVRPQVEGDGRSPATP